LSKFSYLGPLIIAHKNKPVRVKFINNLPTGDAGNLFIPVDHTVMGAGMGPLGMNAMPMNYTDNRGVIHLHGGLTPWISDGSPHMWTTPANENTPYQEGVSVYNVPDMDGGYEPNGTLTFYYNNKQSARLMFYHDHAWGITRLNVYAGEAAGYLLTDEVENYLIQVTNVTGVNPGLQKVLPDYGTPLIIQDKTFLDNSTIATQDPTWNWGNNTTDDLWYPHVYMPTQNNSTVPAYLINPFGRWDYAPWFDPLNFTPTLKYPPVNNTSYDPVNAPWEPPLMPGTPTRPLMEAYMDTPLVNGAAYSNLTVEPKAYRFRILNAANDRFWNLQLYNATDNTEVSMIPAEDGRVGGVPDPQTAGSSFIQIGT
jgi:FtsP/CotA-like multicopper oxidase with cupredoxin domain